MRTLLGGLAALLAAPVFLSAHDVWVQAHTNLVRTGDAVHIDLMLGNHGNDHRDFKMAGKLTPDAFQTFDVTDPAGKTYDLKPDLTDVGYAPKEGFLTAKFTAATPGVYVAAQTADKVVNHGKPTRSYRSAKAYFLVSDSLDKVARDVPGYAKPLGHRIELVPETSPLMPMGPGVAIKVKLLFGGKPAEGVKVSFIPRGVTLKEGTDAEYERATDTDGRAAFTPKAGNYYLVVARLPKAETGEGFETTVYTATLTVFVPEKCPCCAD